ncbi:MAG: GNAT family N-acetyltransferase [Candidatus Moranbacteria bacterium]|nr:GNAT family N-acetyltransferase [Candidatus Moranbacteria bacterium]
MEIIKTMKFVLRPFRKSDAKDVVAAVNNWNVIQYLSNLPFPYGLQDANFWLNKILKRAKDDRVADFVFAIEVNGKVVGAIGIHNIQHEHKGELGYWLAESQWGKGIVSEAVEKVTKFAFKELGIRRVYARVYPSNNASMRVLGKCDYKFEGIEKKGALKNKKYIDTHVYAKVK